MTLDTNELLANKKDWICDLCNKEVEELNQVDDLSLGRIPPHGCEWLCDDCADKFGFPVSIWEEV